MMNMVLLHKKGSKQALDDIGFLAQKYKGQLSRQSERNLPRTKFSHSILTVTKREAHDYAGMLIGLLIALLSDCGREIIQIEREMNPNRIADQVQFIEIILGMEEWLKHGSPTQKQTELLPEVINDFIDKVNFNGQREGMSTKLIKNHLYFHLPKYIEMWGPPNGWDAKSNESNNKIIIKAPAKNTQKRAHFINFQTTL